MKIHRKTKPNSALTLVEGLVIMTVLFMLVLLLLPALAKSGRGSHVKCVNNLKQVGLAFRMWAGDNGEKFPMSISITNGGTMELIPNRIAAEHFRALSNELNDPKILICPSDRERKFGTNFLNLANLQVSYFISLDADAAFTNRILVGDRNLVVNGRTTYAGLKGISSNNTVGWSEAVHTNRGNLCFADGSVRQTTDKTLQTFFQSTGLATNRLLIP